MSGPKTIVVGIDGAHYELFDEWVQSGKLPGMASLLDDGVTADMRSVLPPVTAPNWKAMSTGRNPGQFGIYWWENVDKEARRFHYPSHRNHVCEEFWEVIGNRDSVGVLGVPTTYPPKAVDAFVVAGAPDGEERGYANPPAVERFLDREFDYRVGRTGSLHHDLPAAAEEIHELIDLRFRAAKALLEREVVEFLQVTTFYINSLHHYDWDGDHTLEGWQIIDRHLSDLREIADNVVVVSDHGSTRIDTVFHINAWLHRQGYLAEPDAGVESTLYRLGLTRQRLSSLLGRFGLRERAKRLVPHRLRSRIPESGGRISRERDDRIDWEGTEVVATGQGPVYLTVPEESPRYEEVRSKLADSLQGLTDDAGNTVVESVHKGENIYAGPYADEAPDIVVEQADGIHISGEVGRDSVFTEPEDDDWVAENKRIGMFAAAGPEFKSGDVDEISILDVAPTLLHLHGCLVPDGVDGNVRPELFAPGSDPADRSVRIRAESTRYREERRIRRAVREADL